MKEHRKEFLTKEYLQLIDSDIKELFHFKSSEIEVEIDNRINIITTFLKEKSIYKLNHDDLLFYERGFETMPSYYGPRWTSDYFFPFIQKRNPNTMLILELITLVYSKTIYQMVCSDIEIVKQLKKEDGLFFDRITEKENEMFFDKSTMDFLITANKSFEPYRRVRPLIYYISILKELFGNQPTTRELTIYGEEDTFYITSEMYCNITDKLLEDSEEVRYKEVVQRIIGHYTLYFNKITYFTEIQPLFLKIIYDCLENFDDILTFNNQYLKRSDNE